MDNISSLNYFIPELTLTLTILILIIYDLFLKKEESNYTVYVASAGLVFTMFMLLTSYSNVETNLFMGMVAHDPFSFFFKFLFVLAAFFTVIISSTSSEMKGKYHGEFNTFVLAITLGMFLLASAINLLLVYIAFELVSVTSYVVAGYLKDSKRGSEAALKYVIYGGVSSGIMLYGFSLLYGLTGTLDISEIGRILSQNNSGELTVLVSFLMILAGFGYKIASVPFHFWAPDVYEGSPTAFTAFLSVGPKAAGFAVLIRFFNTAFVSTGSVNMPEWFALEQLDWPQIMMWISAITMTLGNLVALKQDNVKRMLAYSSIAHAGYVLMGIVVLTQDGLFAMMFYLSAYYLMNLGAFFVVLNVADRFGSEEIDGYNGLVYKAPFLAVCMGIFMFSLAGIPPTVGFIGKFYLFAALIKGGSAYYSLAVIGAMNSVVSLYYYARVLRAMFVRGEVSDAVSPIIKTPVVVIGVLALPVMLFGIYWVPLSDFAHASLKLLIIH